MSYTFTFKNINKIGYIFFAILFLGCQSKVKDYAEETKVRSYADIYCLLRIDGLKHNEANKLAMKALADSVNKNENNLHSGKSIMKDVVGSIKRACPKYFPTPQEIMLDHHS